MRAGTAPYNRPVAVRKRRVPPGVPRSAGRRLEEAERLYRDFCALTPFRRPKPFTRSFDSFSAYERWKRAQRNPWY